MGAAKDFVEDLEVVVEFVDELICRLFVRGKQLFPIDEQIGRVEQSIYPQNFSHGLNLATKLEKVLVPLAPFGPYFACLLRKPQFLMLVLPKRWPAPAVISAKSNKTSPLPR